MKICYIGDPISIHLQRWAKWFADRGHEVHVVTYHPHEFDNPNICVHEVKMSWLDLNYLPHKSMLAQLRKFRRIIKEINPDIVHGHYIAAYGLHTAFAGNYPKVLSAWGSDVLVAPKKSKITKWLVKLSLKKADLITCDGENSKEAMINLGTNPEKIKIIFHGVDTKKFNLQKSENFREKLNISDSLTVVSIRNFEPVYDIEILIRCIPFVLEQIPDTNFIIAGKGSQEKYLENLAESLGILNCVRFVGWISPEQLPKYLTLADVYVSTSLSDSFAVSTLEAMACGASPIVTDVGDTKRWIKNGENGFIIPIKDSKSLAKQIIYLLKNEDVRTRFGKINRKIIKERADYDREMGKMEKLYEEVRRYKK